MVLQFYVFMQLLNFQKNNSILYFLKGYVDKFLQGFEQEFILHTRIYFQLFTFLFAIFLKGAVDKYLYRICREKGLNKGLYKGLNKGLNKGLFCIQEFFFNFSHFYSRFFKGVCRQIFIQDL